MQDAKTTSRAEEDIVAWPARLAFGVGDSSLNLVWNGTALLLMFVYTDILGIAPATAGLIYLIAMVWDAVTDPLIAVFVDRTRTRFGRYRPWLMIGSVPLALSYPMAFSQPLVSTIDPVVWALGTHLLLRTCYTIVGVPFSVLQARLTQDADERTRLAGFRMAGAALGGLTVVFATPLIVSMLGSARAAEAYQIAASIAGVMTFAGIVYCALAIREPASGPHEPAVSLREDIASVPILFKANEPLIRVFSIVVVASICLAMFSKNILHYFKYIAEREDLAIWALTLPAALLFVSVPFWVWVASRTTKARALHYGCLIALVGYLCFLAVPASSIFGTFASICILGFGSSSLPVLFWAILPDTVEFRRWKTGIQSETKIFGFATFAQKTAVGINALLLGALLDIAGYVPNTEQAPGTLVAIEGMMAGIPALGVMAIIVMLRGYTLDQDRHREIKSGLIE
ncbi:MAG: glycoside-pentoside-hexuronide (GPH):cation symporter [Erythrobacter sp.]|uniref:MFS transporter n=1 Tax=Erythrobacter sp. TaxID=1042 RepID=UPI002625DA43|nr:glycoside-pentoside-hexuronide (GPH):cation symporter [Erythrobacter sp.]MDJ0979095.1 glycoside-pentoside-hexuronide (GPH):cation symporter [Erythrobacter sp.]